MTQRLPAPRLSRAARVAWAGWLVLAVLLHATLGRGLHEWQHLCAPGSGSSTWSNGADPSTPGSPEDAPGGTHAACAWCLSQAHAAAGGEAPRVSAAPLQPWRTIAPRPAACVADATRWPFAARDPPRVLG
ncbi:hypothetical protein [Azohydromonas aeria]|uniref:hypothetical protein n=1 Tax=Azohydromonas aeria TaxID=2590212 RepID=UPI0012F75ED2|nr:hypothetical protein [Azohydromonas aeria]